VDREEVAAGIDQDERTLARCRRATALYRRGEERILVECRCRHRRCEECGPANGRRIASRVTVGEGTPHEGIHWEWLLTLTTDRRTDRLVLWQRMGAAAGATARDARARLDWYRRSKGLRPCSLDAYVWVLERHKDGFPHAHVMMATGWKWLDKDEFRMFMAYIKVRWRFHLHGIRTPAKRRNWNRSFTFYEYTMIPRDLPNCNIEQRKGPEGSLDKYLVKYLTKETNIDAAAWATLYRRRIWGRARAIKDEPRKSSGWSLVKIVGDLDVTGLRGALAAVYRQVEAEQGFARFVTKHKWTKIEGGWRRDDANLGEPTVEEVIQGLRERERARERGDPSAARERQLADLARERAQWLVRGEPRPVRCEGATVVRGTTWDVGRRLRPREDRTD
jgi:hypothetical protein